MRCGVYHLSHYSLNAPFTPHCLLLYPVLYFAGGYDLAGFQNGLPVQNELSQLSILLFVRACVALVVACCAGCGCCIDLLSVGIAGCVLAVLLM